MRVSHEARLKGLNKKISEVISENRKQCNQDGIGSKQWWKGVDLVSQRRNATLITFDRQSLDQLNEYFGNLCSDNNHMQPVDVHMDPDVKVPTILVGLVWNTLSNLKKTATGPDPDKIPFWLLKEHEELLTPVIFCAWNVSLVTHSWPESWKRANISPLPKIEVPKENGDFRGISVTPVIARAFERSVYNTHVRRVLEDHLGSNQFAYRESGNCTSALLTIQHQICKYVDDNSCKAFKRQWKHTYTPLHKPADKH